MQTEIDDRLLRELRELASEQGRSERELLDEAVLRYLRGRAGLKQLLEDADRWQKEQGVEPLSDEEAMRLADEELHAARRERRGVSR